MEHLRYDCLGANAAGEFRHPQEVMANLGITYERAIPQSIADQWWLLNCEYKELPAYIRTMHCDRSMSAQYELPEAYINA